MQQCLGDEWQVRQLDPIARLPGLAVLLPEPGDACHIHLENRVDVGAGALGFHHALGNLLAHRRHGHDFARYDLNCRRGWTWRWSWLRLRMLLRLLRLLLR